MSIKQLYYTSCRSSISSRTGFQVKAESQGISQDVTNTLNKIMGYQIPPTLATQPLTKHPIALRYYLSQEAILLCSQSNGVDEFDRPGNYFAHALIGNVNNLVDPLPPITYWKSPFWVSYDASSQVELPTLEDFNPELSFDFDAVWHFVNDSMRKEWFKALLSAVIDYGQSARRIIILDDIENIVQWIYAVSLALPPRYRPQLTFSTYHHDPYVAPFIITGTTSDSSFRFNRDEYTSYFILNAHENRISNSPDSDFANYIYDHFNEKQYNNEILEFFDWIEEGRTNQTAKISKRLNDLTNFYMATVKTLIARDSPRAITGTLGLVDELIELDSTLQSDVEDLSVAVGLLADVLAKARNAELISDYGQALLQLRRVSPSIDQSCEQTCKIYSAFILNKQLPVINDIEKLMTQVYSQNVIRSTINQPNILNFVTTSIKANDYDQISTFWAYIGKWLNFDPSTHTNLAIAFQTTFATLNLNATDNPLELPPKVADLLNILLSCTQRQTELVLNIAAGYQKQYPNQHTLKWVYYGLVEKLSIKQRREQFWHYWAQFKDVPLFEYELQRDIMKEEKLNNLTVIMEDWVNHFNGKDQITIFTHAFDFIWQKPHIDREQFAKYLLNKDRYQKLFSPQQYTLLAETVLENAEIDIPDIATSKLYEKFIETPQLSLPTTTRAIIEGTLALGRKEFIPESSIPNLQKHLARVNTQSYKKQVSKLVESFFAHKSPQVHYNLILATYVIKHRDVFWELYWEQFHKTLLEKKKYDTILNILDIWFQGAAKLYVAYPYAVPEFFTGLLVILENIRNHKNYNAIKRDFETQLVNKDWYPVIQKAFPKSKGLLGGLFGR